MPAKKEKNGFFFSKKMMDEINAIPDEVVADETPETLETSTTPEVSKTPEKSEVVETLIKTTMPEEKADDQTDQSAELSALQETIATLKEENQRFQQQLLEKPAVDPAEFEAQIAQLKQTNEQMKKERDDLNQQYVNLQSQLSDQATAKEKELAALSEKTGQLEDQLRTLHTENQELKKAKADAESSQASSVAELQERLTQFEANIQEQDEQITQLKSNILEKEQQITAQVAQVNELQATPEASPELERLQEENKQLRKELTNTQQGVGEVMFAAKLQATQMIKTAEEEVHQTFREAEEEYLKIRMQAKLIKDHVVESKQNVLNFYNGLYSEVDRLAECVTEPSYLAEQPTTEEEK